MKNKIHSLIVEGIVFCGSGLVLLSYSLSSYAKGFNKSWAQSPYLFPLIVAIAMIGLSLWIVGEKTEKRRWVVIALILCVLYYAALAFIKVPYVTIGILSFAYTFSTFEVVTIVFLIAMMIFMGVRKIPVLVFVPIGTTLFLSLAFRTFLHVLLP